MVAIRRSGSVAKRRSGPDGEEPWWDPDDQRRAERATLTRRDLPKKWRRRVLVNNEESLDPYAAVPEAEQLTLAADARVRTALDDGTAAAGPDMQLAVLRVEVFRDSDDTDHRTTWQNDGPAVMAALYRHRWRERDQNPGWVEATWPRFDWEMEPRVDWLRVEDHTDRRHESGLFLYDHLSLWAGRALASLTVRYAPGFDAEPVIVDLADATLARLNYFEKS